LRSLLFAVFCFNSVEFDNISSDGFNDVRVLLLAGLTFTDELSIEIEIIYSSNFNK